MFLTVMVFLSGGKWTGDTLPYVIDREVKGGASTGLNNGLFRGYNFASS